MNKMIQNKLEAYKKLLLTDEQTLAWALSSVIGSGDAEAIKLLFKNISSIDLIRKALPKTILFPILVVLIRNGKSNSMVEIVINKIDDSIIKEQGTLLHEASVYGNAAIVPFLVEKGSTQGLDLINNKDSDGNTAMHMAVIKGHISVVDTLISLKAKLNIKNTAGLSPLHAALLYKHPIIEEKLIAAGASKKMRGSSFNLNYVDLKKDILKNEIVVNETALTFTIPQTEITLNKAISAYCKGMFAQNNNINFFTESINNLKKVIHALQNAAQKNDAHQPLLLLIQLYEIFKYKGSDPLKEDIITYLKNSGFNDLLAKFYTILCVETLSKIDSRLALTYAETAYKYFQAYSSSPDFKTHDTNHLLEHDILFNLGVSFGHFDLKKSLDYFNQADAVLPNDQDVIRQKVNIYVKLDDIDLCLKEVEKITDRELKDLLTLSILLKVNKNSNIETLLKKYNFLRFADGEKLKELDIKDKYILYQETRAEIFMQQQAYKEAFSCYAQTIEYVPRCHIPVLLYTILVACQRADFWSEGLAFIKKFYTDYPAIMNCQDYLPYRYQEFIFYERNGELEAANKRLTFLESYAKLGSFAAKIVSYARLIRCYTDIENKKYEQAIAYLESIASDEAQRIVCFIRKLQQEGGTLLAEGVSTALSKEELFAIESTDQADLSTLAPRAIHQYFQDKKQRLLKQNIEAIEHPKLHSWFCLGKTYDTNSEEIYKIGGKDNFYATIDAKLENRLASKQLNQFKHALQKGIIRKPHGSAGIKFIPNRLVELKINGDSRLYTTEIFKNEKGGYLIVFNDHTNHTGIDRVVSATKNIKITECKNYIGNTIVSDTTVLTQTLAARGSEPYAEGGANLYRTAPYLFGDGLSKERFVHSSD